MHALTRILHACCQCMFGVSCAFLCVSKAVIWANEIALVRNRKAVICANGRRRGVGKVTMVKRGGDATTRSELKPRLRPKRPYTRTTHFKILQKTERSTLPFAYHSPKNTTSARVGAQPRPLSKMCQRYHSPKMCFVCVVLHAGSSQRSLAQPTERAPRGATDSPSRRRDQDV